MADWDRYAQQNRRAWDEIAEVRSVRYRPSATLDPRAAEALGEVRGKRVLHLMCAAGEDTIALAALGAQATGVDISPRQIAIAQRRAADAGLDVRFVAADIAHLPADVAEGGYDAVYSATGVIVWIPDIAVWAAVIARALAAGGRFVLWEAHPVEMCLTADGEHVVIADDYFDTGRPLADEPGWAHFDGGDAATEPKYEFGWTLGQLITALAGAGLRIEQVSEYPSDSDWRFGAALPEAQKLPGRVLIVATAK